MGLRPPYKAHHHIPVLDPCTKLSKHSSSKYAHLATTPMHQHKQNDQNGQPQNGKHWVISKHSTGALSLGLKTHTTQLEAQHHGTLRQSHDWSIATYLQTQLRRPILCLSCARRTCTILKSCRTSTAPGIQIPSRTKLLLTTTKKHP